jgi:hypothetical protein
MYQEKKLDMITRVTNEEYYHICIYPKYMLEVDKVCNTDIISRTHESVDQDKRAVELQFENYRISQCPNLPSRKKCFYVCTRNFIPIWLKSITQNQCRARIFKVSLTGTLFCADASWFNEHDAIKYWKGCSWDDKSVLLQEGLFLGEFKAIEECVHEFRY